MVSIIVPVYNTDAYLGDCIDSVMQQTFNDWELILINDGSTDDSLEICQKYAAEDMRIRLISHPENLGASHSRNLGIDAARGQYISFLDSDDMIHRELLSLLTNHAMTSGTDLLMSGQKHEVFEEGSTQSEITVIWHDLHISDIVHWWLNTECPYFRNIGGKLFKRDIISSLRFDESLLRGEDTLFVYEYILLVHHGFSWTDTKLYFYRKGNDLVPDRFPIEVLNSECSVYSRIRDSEAVRGHRSNSITVEYFQLSSLRDWFVRWRNYKEPTRFIRSIARSEMRDPFYRTLAVRIRFIFRICMLSPLICGMWMTIRRMWRHSDVDSIL